MKEVILMFDPGHGTREFTAGKRSPDQSLIEGEWARDMVKRLIKACEEVGIKCFNIVPENEDIARMVRVKRANDIVSKNPAAQCYYVSVHINAAKNDSKWHNATGFTVWVSKNASEKSVEIARNIYEVAAEDFGLSGNRSVPAEKVWRANYDVIYHTKCPAILTENLFMDNIVECEFLKSERGKEIICNYHLVGIMKTLGLPYSLIIR